MPAEIAEWFGKTNEAPKPKPRAKLSREARQKIKAETPTRSTREEIDAERRHNALRPYNPSPIHPDEEWFRHYNWREKRAKVLQALAAAGTGSTGIANFVNCGAECVIEYNTEDKRYRLRGSYCHNRHCEPCQKAKATLLRVNLKDRLENHTKLHCRFITLTLRHDLSTPLLEQIKKLYSCYKRLRQTPLWKRSQKGGAAMLEVKWSAKSGWHPHLHIVSEGDYMNVKSLSAVWYEITAGSYIVDIRSLDTSKDVAFYVAKYVTKGTNNEVWECQDAAVEWVIATKGVRSCATFGSWRGFKLLAKPASKGEWKAIASLRVVAAAARNAQEWAILMLLNLEECFQYNPHKPRPHQKE
jgi:hypothetical protein